MTVSRQEIYDLMLELVAIPSVSPSPAETELAELIYSKLAELPYFKANKDDLVYIPVPDDPYGRKAVFAIVRAQPETNRTLILTGHFDVVDTSSAGALADVAFRPEEYTRRIRELKMPEEARQDLESGKFLFGRGVMDMKLGIAIQMALLGKYSQAPENLPVNIAFLAVGDEENNSAGMRAAITYLANMQAEGYDFLACINSEGVIPKFPGDTNCYVDIGTIGKIMPMFYCVGRESHVGQYYAGLNANLLAAAVVMELEGNPEWAEEWKGEVYPPPASLKLKDLRDIYSVTLPARAVVYFNHLTVTGTPDEILEKMKSVAHKAFERAVEHMSRSAASFWERAKAPAPVPWEPKVITVQELVSEVAQTFHGDLDGHIKAYIGKLPEGTDEREKSLFVMEELLKFYPDKNPMIVVGFLPPYYPHRTNKRESAREKGLLDAVNRLIAQAKAEFNETLVISEHFASISDLSYVGFQGKREELVPLAHNTPGWGVIYDIDLDNLLKLDIPVVNLGPWGKDAHKFMERVELDYSLEVVPVLLESLIEKLAQLD
jgi:arginine utilization protein RocB